MSDEVTIDVGPVFCPSCKREFGNTERDRLASLVEKLRPYIHHESGCPAVGCHEACVSIVEHACRCGLADLLTEIDQ